MKYIRFLFIILILTMILTACTTQTQGGAAVIHSPCSVPCWQNITPGSTKAEDLEELLKDIPDLDKNGILDLPAWDIFDGVYQFSFKDQKVTGEAYIKEDRVHEIHLFGDLNIPLEQIIHFYGEPEKIIVNTVIQPGKLGGSGIVLEIHLVNFSKGVSFIAFGRDLHRIKINSNTSIEQAIYAQPETIMEIIAPEGQTLQQLERNGRVYEWKGDQEILFNPKK